jgi:hypothetical protein
LKCCFELFLFPSALTSLVNEAAWLANPVASIPVPNKEFRRKSRLFELIFVDFVF